jgi:hypothetical protein
LSPAGGNITDIVLYNNIISDNAGGQNLDYENGRHGILAAGDAGGVYRVERVWIVDNIINNNPEDAIQLGNSSSAADQTLCRYFFIGRNTLTNNGENAIDLKATDHIIVSQNVMSGYKPTSYRAGAVSGSDGSANVINDDGKGPLLSWWLLNVVHNSRVAWRNQAAGGHHFLISNLVFDLNKSTGEAEPTTTGSATGVGYWQSSAGASSYLINNTFHDVHGGMFFNNANLAVVVNNIVSDLVDHTRGWPVNINNSQTTYVTNNLYFDPQGGVRRDANALSITDRINVNPLLVSPATRDFRLALGSPAIDAASSEVAEWATTQYMNTYGVDIRKDLIGTIRPQGAAWDMGAFEFMVSTP